MKKLLLFSSLALASISMWGAVETATYAPYGEIECKNLYNISRNFDQEAFLATPMGEFNNKTRAMIYKDNKLYIAESRTMINGEESNDYAHLIVVDQLTGNVEGRVQLTVNGEPITGLLCANNLGIDDFGNVWMVGLVGNTETTPFKIYHIKDLTTGDSELIATLQVPSDESEAFGRHDYCDIVGDVTGKEAGTVFMSPVASGSDTFVIGFEREEGTDEWGPHMEGYYSAAMGETYPADQTTWNGAPFIRIVRDEDHAGSLYYIDAFVTYPTLYDLAGSMLESFNVVDAELLPKENANGVCEFEFAGKFYMAYTLGDYDYALKDGTTVRVVELGPDQNFAGMTLAWDFPQEKGLGTITDTGSRMMGMCPNVVTDENGKQACYLSLYKCNGGLATYMLNEPGFVASSSDIMADTTDNNAPVEYFNMMGQRLTNPASGQIVIKKQGKTIDKVVL